MLWGTETTKAVENFHISGEPIPARVVHWLGRIKSAAAEANAELGLIDADLAADIVVAGDAIAAGEYDAEFPIDVFQTGSGTSSNMNANEVISALTDGARPIPTITSTSARARTTCSRRRSTSPPCRPRTTISYRRSIGSATRCRVKAVEFVDVVKAGRTHLMDAVPVTLGQEFGGYAAQVALGG